MMTRTTCRTLTATTTLRTLWTPRRGSDRPCRSSSLTSRSRPPLDQGDQSRGNQWRAQRSPARPPTPSSPTLEPTEILRGDLLQPGLQLQPELQFQPELLFQPEHQSQLEPQ